MNNKKIKQSRLGIALPLLWGSIFTVVGYMSLISYDGFKDAKEKAIEQSVAYAHLIASHDNYSIKMAESIIISLMDHLTNDDFNGDVSAERRKEVEDVLFKHRDRLNGIASFTIIGKNGIRKFGVVNKNFTDLSERPYFKKLRDGKDDIFVSSAEEGLASGKPGLHIAMRFMHNNEFAGVVVINLAIKDVFYPFYTGLNLGRNSNISVFDTNRLIIDYPNSVMVKNRKYHSDVIAEIDSGKVRGSTEVSDPSNKENKQIVSYEMLEGTNIFAGVGLSLKTIYDQAYQEMYAAILAATISILAGLFATIAMRTSENRRRELSDSLEVIQHMAHHDALTGLPNRNYLIQKVDSFCMDKKYKDDKFSVIFIDLDKFKWINDNLGHGAGDLYLMQVSERLKSVLGVNDIVSRHGGDEFIIVAQIKDDKDTVTMCDRVMDVFKTPFDLDGTMFNGGASLGAASYPMDGENFKALAHAADLAMYESKERGRGCYTIYKAGMGA